MAQILDGAKNRKKWTITCGGRIGGKVFLVFFVCVCV